MGATTASTAGDGKCHWGAVGEFQRAAGEQIAVRHFEGIGGTEGTIEGQDVPDGAAAQGEDVGCVIAQFEKGVELHALHPSRQAQRQRWVHSAASSDASNRRAKVHARSTEFQHQGHAGYHPALRGIAGVRRK